MASSSSSSVGTEKTDGPTDTQQQEQQHEYPMSLRKGQRKYGGPPADWNGPPPKKGSEVFVGKLPRDLLEDSLLPLFQGVGTVYEMRLMMDLNGFNRGYAFVTFAKPADAARAIQTLNNYEIRPKRFIGVIQSLDNCRLFVGGIPKDKIEEDIKEEMSRITDGVVRVILYSSVADKTKNRGFAFVEYENHRAAAVARRKFMPNRLQLWGKTVAVDWAEPEPVVDDEVLSKVRILYVRNLLISTKENELAELFNKAGDNGVEKVKILNDFAFVHFATRQQAQQAMEALQDFELNGTRIEITWAKPVTNRRQRIVLKHQPQLPTGVALLAPPPTHPAPWHSIPFNPYIVQPHLPIPAYPQHQYHPFYQSTPPYLLPSNVHPNRMAADAFQAERAPLPSRPDKPRESSPAVSFSGEEQQLPTANGWHPQSNNVEALVVFCQLRQIGEPIFEVFEDGENRFVGKVSIPHLGPSFVFLTFEAYETEEDARQVIAGYVLNHLNQWIH